MKLFSWIKQFFCRAKVDPKTAKLMRLAALSITRVK